MKTAMITGASGGVATALASKLLDEGWRVALVSRGHKTFPSRENAYVTDADVATEAGAVLAVYAAQSALGAPPTGLAHCAGNSFIAPIGRTRESDYRQVLATNLDSGFFTLKAWVAARTLDGGNGSAVLFSSVAAAMGIDSHVAIAAAKAGVESLVRSLAADHSHQSLRFNAIAPGLMRTPMTARFLGTQRSAKPVAAQYPLGRHGEAEDAAALAMFLLSEQSSWITGQVIGLDGGLSAVRPLVRASSQ